MTQELRVRNYSERTVRSYITSISQLSVYYKTSPDKITRDQVKNYAYHLIHSKDASVSGINQLISAWKIFQVDVLVKQQKLPPFFIAVQKDFCKASICATSSKKLSATLPAAGLPNWADISTPVTIAGINGRHTIPATTVTAPNASF